MRGTDHQQSAMFSYISAERALRVMADAVLQQLGPVFDAIYARSGRPSIAPEKLLRALLLQVLYTVRSERLLMEQLDYNFLFPLVRGAEHRRPGVGRDRVQQEPRAVA